MPPPDNRMQVGQQQMPGGMNPQMIQQLMQQYAQQGGMQNAAPDQGMQQMNSQLGMISQKPMQIPGGMREQQGPSFAQNFAMQVPPGFDPTQQGPANSGSFMPPGPPGSPSYPGLPPGMDPSQLWSMMNSKPMPKPGMQPMQSAPQGGQMPPQVQTRQPMPAPRLPPNAGVYKNPGTGQMMNETPRFSGQVNPATVKPPTPQTGGAMTMPAGPATDVPADPIRMAMPAAPTPKPIQGSPPFNPDPATRFRQNAPSVEQPEGSTKQGAGVWQGSAQEQKKKAGLASALTSRVTKPATR